jgi:predicted permease
VLLAVGGATLAVALALAFAPLVIPLATRFERSLRSGARAGSDGPGVRRMRTTLVALQVAVSLALLFGGGLVVRSVRNLMEVDFGYDTAELVRARLRFPTRQFPDSASMTRFQQAFEAEALARTGAPIGFSTVFPFYVDQQQRIETGVPGEPERRAAVDAVGSHYFAVAGMTVRAGRVFDARDNLAAERVAIVSETLARRLWPNGDAVGRQILTGADMNSGTPATVWRTVVGVVNDVRESHRDVEFSEVYLPAAQMGTRFAAIFGKPGARVREWHASVRGIAIELNPYIDVGPPVPLAEGMNRELDAPRFLMSVLMGLALLAVGIALIGIYGVTAYAVEQRRREVAIRSALGATPRALVALFVADGGRVVVIGVVAGVVGAVWLGRLLRNQVYGVAPMDVVTLAAATLVIAAGSLVASWLPARRAAALDTAGVLRAD